MSEYRFKVGTNVMCNLGINGWKAGKIIALNYREPQWPEDKIAPYQVALDEDYSLIYVPNDNDRLCREITIEDKRIMGRRDALAELQSGGDESTSTTTSSDQVSNLTCEFGPDENRYQTYRHGRCHCCNDCPNDWLHSELYSEHYRAAERNNLKVTQYKVELGVYKLGDTISQDKEEFLENRVGFMQAPTLVRLPPGITFSDEGYLSGLVKYDPHRAEEYDVDFVAVSTKDWADQSTGIIRLEIRFTIEGNLPPAKFNRKKFERIQEDARSKAAGLLTDLNDTWSLWEVGKLDNRTTCDRMLSDLNRLRELAESHPRLDNGKWWGHLGGFHMNVHKLLENTLFECELYLGYALTFGDDGVRYYAEQNLRGCYQKRLLEAARFMWYDGTKHMLNSRWSEAIETFRLASDKKGGWGWAVNYGDIWISEAVAVMMQGLENTENSAGNEWIDVASKLIDKARKRASNSGVFDTTAHPWVSEVNDALNSYRQLVLQNEGVDDWIEEFRARTIYWCSHVLAGGFPFPPKCRERLDTEMNLILKLPVFNQ